MTAGLESAPILHAPILPAPIVVIGGGITGLATAYFVQRALAQAAQPAPPVLVLEASPDAGGKLRTTHRDGFLVEAGPDSFLTTKPAALELCLDLGLGDQLIPTLEPRGAYVLRRGRLVPIPPGMRLLQPTRPLAFLRSPLLSLPGRLRVLAEPLIPARAGSLATQTPGAAGGTSAGGASAGKDGATTATPDAAAAAAVGTAAGTWPGTDAVTAVGRDESLAAFVTRRYGREMLDALAEPLLAGIHVADPWQLSIEATFPQLTAAERRRAMRRKSGHGTAAGAGGASGRHAAGAGGVAGAGSRNPSADVPASLAGSVFASLRDGMGQLVAALCAELGQALRLNAGAEAIEAIEPTDPSAGAGYRVRLAGGASIDASAVVVTTPAAVAAGLLNNLSQPLAAALRAQRTSSSAIVTLAYPRDAIAHPLTGSGFVVPKRESRGLLACTWTSSKFAGRAPAGSVLLRGFVGGWSHAQLLDQQDAELVALVRRELAATALGRGLLDNQPLLSTVHRWQGGTPQYTVGHLQWTANVRQLAAAHRGLVLAGAPYGGVGIPDCIRQARAAADQALQALSAARLG